MRTGYQLFSVQNAGPSLRAIWRCRIDFGAGIGVVGILALTSGIDRQASGIGPFKWEECGFGCWIAIEKSTQRVIGYVGISVPHFLPEILPAVEVGWRFDPDIWGRGYATEGAAAALDEAFNTLGLDAVCSAPQSINPPSSRVCDRLGMRLGEWSKLQRRPVGRLSTSTSTGSRKTNGFAATLSRDRLRRKADARSDPAVEQRIHHANVGSGVLEPSSRYYKPNLESGHENHRRETGQSSGRHSVERLHHACRYRAVERGV
ncbi:MAG: GNAT family N-acetyltransferase [Caulobacteraceae bacterium]|nr:GNAT family N-acetyltransferase [Caulobacteraceae bacterium]